MNRELIELLKELGATAGVALLKFLISSPAITFVLMFVVVIVYEITHWVTPENWQILFFTVIAYSTILSPFTYNEIKEAVKRKTNYN